MRPRLPPLSKKFLKLKKANKKNTAVEEGKGSEKAIGCGECLPVFQWEKGQTLPRASLLPTIAELYGCTVDELLKKEK